MNTLTVVRGEEIKVPKGKRLYLSACGKKLVPDVWADWHAELYFFGTKLWHEKFLHFKRLVELQWGDTFEWDEWADLFFGALCGDVETVERCLGKKIDVDEKWQDEVIASGAAATGKSSKSALWILNQWLCAQAHTSGILTSTSLDQLKRRIWAELCEWIGKAKFKLPLEIIPSDTEIRFQSGNKRSAIFGIAVKSGGNPQEAVDRIKGIHNQRVFVVVDEMTAVPPAITVACRNLNKGTREFQFIGLGNAISRTDPHGMHAEPVNGWGGDVDTYVEDFWATKMGGCCMVFDGHNSPAIRDPERFFFYINKEQMEKDEKFYGGQNTPEYWSNVRGRWPPTGLSKTVMDDALLAQFHTSDKAIWKTGFTMGGAFDPAFEGGDRRVLYPFQFGEFSNGLTGINFLPPIIVSIDVATDVRWIHYAIADAVKAACEGYTIDGKAYPILPENFASDTTGEGGGFFSVLSGRWSPLIQSVEFGVAADDVVVSSDRPVTYKELYANKATMLWYVFRRFVEGDQVRGLTDAETRTELTTRKYEPRGNRTAVEPKAKMKLTGHRSPDKADAAVIATEILRRKGVLPAGNTGGGAMMNVTEWNAFASRTNMDHTPDYAEEGWG